MHRVELYVNSENARAIKCYKKVGFVECGRQHESIYYDGHYCDSINMEILKSNFKGD
jgi:RimJ/RimL family protein N-acetyltransferase